MNQVIRIIGGTYRGKKISFPAIEGLRPTPDRVRETLFNWLMHDVREATCLDAFAGSGALGFEAFSRGAHAVTLVEQSPVAYANLKKQALSFQSARLNVIQADAATFLAETPLAFDVIFFDPPFANLSLFEGPLKQGAAHALRPGGFLYLESPHEIALDRTVWEPLKLKQAGRVFYSLYKKQPSAALFLNPRSVFFHTIQADRRP